MPTQQSPSKHAAGCQFVRDKICAGEWKPGHQLPSQAAWAAGTPGMKILYGTLRGIYLTLKTEGWIKGVQGEGVYVADEPPIPAAAKKTKAPRRGSIVG